MTPYRWNAKRNVWQFYEKVWGGWQTLRITPHVSSRPMSFAEGFRHIVTHTLVWGNEAGAKWLYDAAHALPLDYVHHA